MLLPPPSSHTHNYLWQFLSCLQFILLKAHKIVRTICGLYLLGRMQAGKKRTRLVPGQGAGGVDNPKKTPKLILTESHFIRIGSQCVYSLACIFIRFCVLSIHSHITMHQKLCVSGVAGREEVNMRICFFRPKLRNSYLYSGCIVRDHWTNK